MDKDKKIETEPLEIVEPIGKRVLIRKDEDKKQTKGGIQLPDNIEIPAIIALSEINGSETFIHVEHDGKWLVVQQDGIQSHKIGGDIIIYANPGSFFVYDQQGKLVASPARAA